MKRSIMCLMLCALSAGTGPALAQPPVTVRSLNNNWEFALAGPSGATMKWDAIDLPHTWNKADVLDDVAGYHRGAGWYRKKLVYDTAWKNRELFLFFEGANQVTEVLADGIQAGKHLGGYTRFYVPVSRFFNGKKQGDETELIVKVNNAHTEDIPPLSADFTFYGGLYRDVWLLALNKVHFSVDTLLGTRNFYLETPVVDSNSATVKIRSSISDRVGRAGGIRLVAHLRDAGGKVVSSVEKRILLKGKETPVEIGFPSLNEPRLWSPDAPYLYQVECRLLDEGGQELDLVSAPVGFRWYKFDAEKGFFLNGKPLKLVGASRHQDYEALGNAVPAALARRDVQLLKEMGGNFLRVAHYPQQSAVLETCDRLGIIASVEIPIVNEIGETDAFRLNSLQMLKEMMAQNYNHPSVVIWAYMNEVLLRPRHKRDPAAQKKYFARITSLAALLDSTCRAYDPARYTMLAHHGDFQAYKRLRLTDIPMLVGWNLYSGWYGGNLEGFPAFLDRHRKELPGKPLLVTEYGADADPRIRSARPVRFDKSVEYATLFHQYYLRAIMERPFVAAAMIWNLADFNSETRNETMPHFNNKGLMQAGRVPKDAYFLYRSALREDPFLHILAGSWKYRSGLADSASGVCTLPVEVASNLDSLELWWNGLSMGKKKVDEYIGTWMVPFKDGMNRMEVTGSAAGVLYRQTEELPFSLIPTGLKDFGTLRILLGGDRYYIDESNCATWIPSPEYRPGSFGHIGGEPYRLPGSNRLPYGTDKAICGTDDDPVYQTQQVSIQRYKLDVSPGEYELTLHFAELQGVQTIELVYNLEHAQASGESSVRIFDVHVNGRLFLHHFNIREEAGAATALSRKLICTVKENEGIVIDFVPVEGQAVLNALQVTKLY